MGVEVTFADAKGGSELAVVTPTPGGPADRAGIRAGDVIEAVGGVATKGLSLYEASDLLQGAEGSEVGGRPQLTAAFAAAHPPAHACGSSSLLLCTPAAAALLLRTLTQPHPPPPPRPCTPQVTLRVRSSGKPARDVTLARQRVNIVPVSYQLCSGVGAPALPAGACHALRAAL